MEERTYRLSDQVVVDDANDTITVKGIKIAAELFDTFGRPSPRGEWSRVIVNDRGVVMVQTTRIAISPRHTYTFAALELTKASYDEIAAKLRAAGYDHAFTRDGAIDMHGIGVVLEES